MPRIGSTSDSPLDLLTGVLESGISLKEPQALQKRRAGHRSWKGGRQRAQGSVNFQLTPRLEAHGIVQGCSQALPASVDGMCSANPFSPVGVQNRIRWGVMR